MAAGRNKKRGGIHLRVAATIDAGFAGDEWDLQAWQTWGADQLYVYPEPTDRKAFADLFDKLTDGAEQEAALYSTEAFSYMIWNRAVQSIRDERHAIFDALAAAGEGADPDDGDADDAEL